jgi:hypothetical protein
VGGLHAMPLNVDEARELASRWRERFFDEAAFEESWSRYFGSAKVPDASRLEAWLAKDLQTDQVKHAGIVKEPLLPVRQNLVLGDCDVCKGKYFVRHDVDINHPDFGKVFPCPACRGRH